jgi:DHA3 family macrolide efflux protein-like MFS transporter
LFFAIPQVFTPAGEQLSVWADFKVGVRYVTGNRGLLILFGIIGLVVLTVMPTFTLTPLLVKEHFNGGVGQVAFMEALAGIGIIVGGVIISAWGGFKRKVVTLLASFAISCFTVALTALMPSERFVLATVWWFISGLTFSTGNAPFVALLQTTVPNQIQGRVLSLLNTTMGLAGPIGLAIAGPLGEAIGVQGVFIVGGTLSALVCLAAFASPALMRMEETNQRRPIAR